MKIRSLIIISLLSSLTSIPLQAQTNQGQSEQTNQNSRIYQQLLEIEKELPQLEKQIEKNNKQKKDRIYINGMVYFENRYVKEEKSPINITDRRTLFKHPSSYEPNLKLNLFSDPKQYLYFNMTLGFEVDFTGEYTGSTKLCNEFVAGTGLNSQYGNYNIKFGGPMWIKSSPLTFSTPGWNFKSAPFDRNSWDPVGNSDWYYKSRTQLKSREEDVRSGNGIALKGILLEMNQLPLAFSSLNFYGMTSDFYGNSSDIFFGNLAWEYMDQNKLGFAYKFLSIYPDGKSGLLAYNYNYSVFNQGQLADYWTWFFEYGLSDSWGKTEKKVKEHAVILNVAGSIPDIFIFDSLLFGMNSFLINPDYVSAYSGVFHTQLPYDILSIWYSVNPQQETGVIYNNRKGISGKTGFSLSFFSMDFNLGHSESIEKTAPSVNFPHSLDHSIWYFIFGTIDKYCKNSDYDGGNLSRYWEGISETYYLKDKTEKKRHYGYATVNMGYDLSEILKRTYLLASSYQTRINNAFFLLPGPDPHNLLFGRFYDLFLAQGVYQDFFIITYIAKEEWRSTMTEQELKQDEFSYGAGINYEFMERGALYFKYKRYRHKDFIRPKNNFYGNWYSVEFKIFF